MPDKINININSYGVLKYRTLIRGTVSKLFNLKSLNLYFAKSSTKRIRLNLKESIIFSSSLLTLIERGIHLYDACQFLTVHSADKKCLKISKLLLEKIGEGNNLSQGILACNIDIPPILSRYISIGDETSNLSSMLKLALSFLNKEAEFKKKIIASLIYPSIISVFGLGLIGFLLGVIFPKIIPIVLSLHVPLPLSTRLLIFISNFIQNYWYLIFLAIFLAYFSFKYIFKTAKGYNLVYKILLKIPLLSGFIKLNLGRNVSFALSNYIKAGSPISSALFEWEKNTKHFIKDEWKQVRLSVESGLLFSEALYTLSILPLDFRPLISIGEKAGSCEEGLSTVCVVYEKRIEETATRLSVIIEPLIIAILGIAVCGAALSIITPLYSMLSHVGKM